MIITFHNSYTRKRTLPLESHLELQLNNKLLCSAPDSSQKRCKSRVSNGLVVMKFTILTTISSTPIKSPPSCCEASALGYNSQWVNLALGATPCTNARSPRMQPDIRRSPSVHKPTQYFHSRLFTSKKSFRIANNSCALQLAKMGLQKNKCWIMLSSL